jgi:hypothetical protein
MPSVKCYGSPDGLVIAITQYGVRAGLVVARDVFTACVPRIVPMNVRSLISKVQKHPQLETRIRDRHRYAVVASLLQSVVQLGVFVDVKDAPNLVKP